MEIKIREATIFDKEKISELWKMLHTEQTLYFKEEYVENFFDIWNCYLTNEIFKNENKGILVAEINNDIVGFLEFEINEFYPPIYKKRKLLHIHSLFVLKRFRGLGVGKSLLNEALKIAKEKNLSKLRVFVFFNNPAVDFYKKFGFNKRFIEMVFNVT